jgi:TetR/AcrR family transcriptional regulator, transcriptional repressor for nem operon
MRKRLPRSYRAFGSSLIDAYASYFAFKLERHLNDASRTPLNRLRAFVDEARAGMARHDFRRGCLIGNLGQEMGALPESFRARLNEVFRDWQKRVARCLKAAQAAKEVSPKLDCDDAAAFFWIGWEGAVLRAKLEGRADALELFARHYFARLSIA